ncbi:capsular biosynthesis protein [Stappia sp. F7233]|uniref:Capsular biosynthesis protein n=1 Tax=Stappia albiluteola TaxID=2758565 RepID=A0A839A8Z4_9HYPH|nr:capsular biosynthesis protein [Stappia albiluteola]MBA5775811.1 capsular biosynthesis protein [Stappia albiluteola]
MSDFRTVLFLQGPPGYFFRTVADEVEAQGHRALRINFGPADWFFWHDARCTQYRGRLKDWPVFLERFVRENAVTDILYYQDRLPYHAAARDLSQRMNVQAIACEFGYLRPDWITLERGGMSALSHFPEDPASIIEAARNLPPIDRRPLYNHPFHLEAFYEVVFNLINVFFWFLFPFFSQDKYYHPIPEYLWMIPRLFLSRHRNRHANYLIDDVVDAGLPYFVFPLQLQSDYQLRYNAPFDHLLEAAEVAMTSFARHAPRQARLVFKVHPLDQGIEPWRSRLRALARKYGLKRRVYVIDGGNLDTLLRNAAGMLTVNSTTALHAARVGCPTKVLGIAVYDIEGIASQRPLDEFWRAPPKPDPDLVIALERLMATGIQVKGNFYVREGQRVAAREIVSRIIGDRVNCPQVLRGLQPRVAKARAHGLPVDFDEILASGQRTNRWYHAAGDRFSR